MEAAVEVVPSSLIKPLHSIAVRLNNSKLTR